MPRCQLSGDCCADTSHCVSPMADAALTAPPPPLRCLAPFTLCPTTHAVLTPHTFSRAARPDPSAAPGSVRCRHGVRQLRGPCCWGSHWSFIPLVIHPSAAAKATAGAARRRFRGLGAAAEVRPEPLGDLVDATVDRRVHLGDALEPNPDGLAYLSSQVKSSQVKSSQVKAMRLSPTPMVSRTCDSVASS